MTSVPQSDMPPRRARKRWLAALLGLIAIVAAIWFIRAEMWPCGALDRTSGCVSGVRLDVAAAGLDPDTAEADWWAFDLSPSGDTALVGIWDKANGAEPRSVLALYDTATGAVLRVLHDTSDYQSSGEYRLTQEAALSPDGSLAAAITDTVQGDELVSELIIYDTADGRVLKTITRDKDDYEYRAAHCNAMLDFSADGTKIQCGYKVFDIATGNASSVRRSDDSVIYPVFADESLMQPIAPDGTEFLSKQDKQSFALNFNGMLDLYYFAPDSVGLLGVQIPHDKNSGKRFYIPSIFRQMSAVEIWDGKAKELQRSFYSNRLYIRTAWSRDSAYFGFVTDDLRLEVFKR
ncbi:hypothetical protein [Tabrizicola sp.]|uniref:hypothetical protein n=1 Tax=Tabrizicola sp. TaxID=2005166 RepID=UPI003F349D1D